MITKEEHDQLVSDESAGKLLIGIDRPVARRFFTDVKHRLIAEKIQERIYFERIVVQMAFYFSWIFPLTSIYFAIDGFGWWSFLIYPLSLIYWFSHLSGSSRGDSRIFSSSILLVSTAILVVIIDINTSIILFLSIFAVSLFLGRLAYTISTFFLRTLVIRNRFAFDLLKDEAIRIKT